MRLLIAILVFSITSCGFENSKLKEVDDYIRQLHQRGKFDGTIAIATMDGVVYESSLGLADRTWNIEVAKDTRFDIASINKSFQAYMTLQLVDAGIVSLDDLLTDHIAYAGEHAESITIRQVLTHTSGIASYDAVPDSLRGENFKTFKRQYFKSDEYLEFISQLPTVGAPGEQFYYSNFGYHLIALMLESKLERHFSFLLDSMICQPLGLSNTYAPLNNDIIYPRLAKSYLKAEGTFVESPFIDYSLGRRIFSTSVDLTKWGQEMVNPTLVSKELVDEMMTNHIKEINPNITYGFGWAVFDGLGDYQMGKLDVKSEYVIHGGATDGYRSLVTIYNNGEWIISHLTNIGEEANELEITEQVLTILTN
ncbi:serine hydrolase domain-containing protein [Ekhidna sp.]